MNSQNKELRKVRESFPKAFINENNEMIIYPARNIYFPLGNVHNELELDCKVLEYCSREASKSVAWQSKRYHYEGICHYFGRRFTEEEMELIYAHLGNGINRELCIAYIESGFNLEVLRKE